MKSLSRRPAAHGPTPAIAPPHQGRRRFTWPRTLSIVLALLITVFGMDRLAGHFLRLDAEGVVVRDSMPVAAAFGGRLERLAVGEGDHVPTGAVMAIVGSSEVLAQLADLSARRADLTERIQQRQRRASIEPAVTGSLLGASAPRMEEDSDAVRAALADTVRALERLRADHAGGRLLAPRAGTVTKVMTRHGAAVVAGAPLLEISVGRQAVLALLPPRYVRTIMPGATVELRAGAIRSEGRIHRLLRADAPEARRFRVLLQADPTARIAEIWPSDESLFEAEDRVRVTAAGWFR